MTPDPYVTRTYCDRMNARVLAAIKELSDRLYKDNGQLSIQSRLGRMEIYWKLLSAVTFLLASAVIVEIVRRAFAFFNGGT